MRGAIRFTCGICIAYKVVLQDSRDDGRFAREWRSTQELEHTDERKQHQRTYQHKGRHEIRCSIFLPQTLVPTPNPKFFF